MATIGKVYRSGKALILFLDIPFLYEEKFLLLQNTDTTKNAPIFKIVKKASLGFNAEVGGIWEKTSDNGVKYKSGTIEHPLANGGKFNFAIFNLDEPEKVKGKDGKEREIIATVAYSAPKPKKTDDFGRQERPERQAGNAAVYDADGNPIQQPGTVPAIDIDDDETIPF